MFDRGVYTVVFQVFLVIAKGGLLPLDHTTDAYLILLTVYIDCANGLGNSVLYKTIHKIIT